MRGLYGPALLLGLLAVAGVGFEAVAASPASDPVARGRRVYIAEGCVHCHSQYVRPGTHDEAWWGPSRPFDRGEQPPLVGARRQGPDLLAVGNRRSAVWQELHLRDPQVFHPGSRMPSYAHLFAGDGQKGRDLVAYLQSLGARTAAERSALTTADPVAPPAGPPSPERGAALFARYCATCHGASGRGDGPLSGMLKDPFVDLHRPFLRTPVQLARTIRHGLPPTSMPGHEWLTDRQVADLAAYVQTLPVRKETP